MKSAFVRSALLFAAAALPRAAPAAEPVQEARVPTDCPLRNEPFSVDSPLIDILLDSRAAAVATSGTSGALSRLPAGFSSTRTPSFASIITLRLISSLGGFAGKPLADLDAKLRAIPVSDADRVARCGRYDDDRPRFSLTPGRPHLLLFEKINGFKDPPGFNAAHAMFIALAAKKGWDIAVTDKGGAFTPAILARFDAVIWNNISGDVLTLSQRRAFRSYIEHGGAFVGVHGSGGDPVYFWNWYADRLLGARFAGHPHSPQFQEARIVVEDRANPAAAHLPAEWAMKDEWYSFKTNPRAAGADIIATLDEKSYHPNEPGSEPLAMGDHPIAWSNRIGKGRMFYSAIGHLPGSYSNPHYVAMIEDALTWIVEREAGSSGNPGAGAGMQPREQVP